MRPYISSKFPPRPSNKQLTYQFHNLRRAEKVLLIYFSYTTLMGLLFGVHVVSLVALVSINAGIAALFLLLLTRAPMDAEWRDLVPYPLSLLCYREAGWLASAVNVHGLEQRWIEWDRMVLDEWHGRAVIESLGAFLPTILEAAYLSVYIVGPLAVAAVYLFRRREQADRLWAAFLLGLMLSYVQFPFWPSEPPRTVFAGEDLPSFLTPLRRFNLFLVGNFGIHSSVFPSAHVSGAMSVALMLRRAMHDRIWVGNVLLTIAVLIAAATVYGRYHYLVDALAGAAMGVVAYHIAVRL